MASTTSKTAVPPPPPPPPQQSKPLRNPTEQPPPPPPNPSSNPNPPPPSKPLPLLTPTQEDISLSRATHLTRPELLRRRSRYLKQLSRCYRDYYWALMEELKIQYREYYWKFGVSPFKQDQVKNGGERERERENGLDIEGIGENIEGNNNNNNTNVNTNNNNNNNSSNNNNNLGATGNNNIGGSSGGNHRCAFVGCKLKPMALTNFCHLHILSDSKQKLYKACSYVIKSAQAGPITCGKPILRSTVPSLCTVHLPKAQKHVSRALKKAGLNVNLSTKVAPKFHVIVAEYVRHIQAKRRAARRAIANNVVVKEEIAS